MGSSTCATCSASILSPSDKSSWMWCFTVAWFIWSCVLLRRQWRVQFLWYVQHPWPDRHRFHAGRQGRWGGSFRRGGEKPSCAYLFVRWSLVPHDSLQLFITLHTYSCTSLFLLVRIHEPLNKFSLLSLYLFMNLPLLLNATVFL